MSKMRTFRDFLREESKDAEFGKSFRGELERTRIALEIVYYREKAGFTQEDLAEKIGTSQSAIARLENPDYKGYSVSVLRKIADVLDLELTVSFHKRDEEVPPRHTTQIFHVVGIEWGKKQKEPIYRYDENGEITKKGVA